VNVGYEAVSEAELCGLVETVGCKVNSMNLLDPAKALVQT
jgi:hypothetical protein